MGAERIGPRRLAKPEPELRLEPLAVGVFEGDQRDRRGTDPRRDAGDVVVGAFGGRIEEIVAPERGDPFRFVSGRRVR